MNAIALRLLPYWDHIAWLAARDDFFEYKRSRR
jgi:hypothetical protein